jgi:hypothetical protein
MSKSLCCLNSKETSLIQTVIKADYAPKAAAWYTAKTRKIMYKELKTNALFNMDL